MNEYKGNQKGIMKYLWGPGMRNHDDIQCILNRQKKHYFDVLNDVHEPTYGITRGFKLLLCLLAFCFPLIHIKHHVNKKSFKKRKLITDFYVLFKIILFILILVLLNADVGKTLNDKVFIKYLILFLTTYSLLETITSLGGIIFLSKIYNPIHSNERSVLLTLLNYIEITLGFGIIYKNCDLILKEACSKVTSFEAVYFSFVTSTTLGYGEYLPKYWIGQLVVILQVIVMFILVVVVINYFLNYKKSSDEDISKNK